VPAAIVIMSKIKDTKTQRMSAETSGKDNPVAARRSSDADVAAFLNKAAAMHPERVVGQDRGRLIFAMDATMSRQPTWDTACQLQADMFRAAGEVGGLDVQLIYFRGFSECRASKWVNNTEKLASLMSRIDCRGGHTQIERVLRHARNENEKARVQALVYVGDAMEENVDTLCALAGELGLVKVPVFAFQEGHDPMAARAFQEIARLSGGAYCAFDPGSAAQLRELLSAVAVYAAGGRKALADHASGKGQSGRLLLQQLPGGAGRR
jgi:hypothetical protein